MDLTLSDEQRLLRESADRFVSETYTTEHRRKTANEPLGFSAAIWKQFADLGWLALPIPEAHGGLGGGAIETGILMEALPETPWRPLISALGYSLGFIFVTMGRQQLFTETTLTAMLPVLHGSHAGHEVARY